MGDTDDSPDRRGRLHGRLFHVLGGFSALVALVALWQFGVFGGDPDRDPLGTVDEPDTAWLSASEDGTTAADSVAAASTTVESASESTASETSAPPSDAATSSVAASEPSPSQDDEDEEEAAPSESCSASLTLKDEWEDSIEVTVVVVNTGSAEIGSWEIDLDLDGLDVYNHWNMRELDGGRYGSESYNGRLDPDEDAVAGFQAEVDGDFELPSSVHCEASS